ncbi:NUDIX domain-containing protein [Micromonospora sp. WMMD710]|uniref:NUDIX hydrolase n=1 Tax=Micromonospora sp. WMMD710 TaxID=3016085 RepID=UPI002416B49B|nr:NUDIX domain-containing protein [Micromonospora sp. WMMD710]MDG4756967.1 NUDIX domain-containing protein [Micromonospora sp. WMMD710]
MSALTWAVAAVVTDDVGRVLLCRQGRGERRYALPGGRLRPAESPVRAAVRDIRAETGWEIELADLVGVYHLAGPGTVGAPAGRAGPLPDVLVHVFRARAAGDRPAADPPPGCRLSWHAPVALPEAVTPLTRAAVTDALAGRSGVLRDVSWAPGTVEAPPPALAAEEGWSAADQDRRPETGQDERPGVGSGMGSGVRPGAGQPPEQRGEAVDPSLRP